MNLNSAELANFFVYLFEERKLAPITIKGYRSAIARVYRLAGDFDPGKDQDLSLLMDNFSNERPTVQHLFPKWSLTIVLEFLKSSVFEPLERANVNRVLQKSVFLIALATAARVSELHALSVSKNCLRFNDNGSVSLLTTPGFIAKNRLPENGNQAFNLKPLLEDKLLCPVRSLEIYLDKTDNIRQDNDQMFLTSNNKKTSPQFISNTIKKVIEEAYNFSCSQSSDLAMCSESSDISSSDSEDIIVAEANAAINTAKEVSSVNKKTSLKKDVIQTIPNCAKRGQSTQASVQGAKDVSTLVSDRSACKKDCVAKDVSRTNPNKRSAHEVRAVAASLAYHKGASLVDIIQAVGWTSTTTFGRFYLRNMEEVATQDTNIRLPV